MTRVTLEICVDSPQGLADAVAAGADRIELCAALPLSGITPSAALMRLAAASGCATYAMIRPHLGAYHYSGLDLDVMRWEIDAVRSAGLAGVVIGANHRDGSLDVETLEPVVRHAAGLGLTLHRAFDLAPDQSAALEAAIELGFERVLTSGGAPTAPEGVERIAALVRQAAGRINVMAGSGVTPATVADIVRRTGVPEVHGSCGRPAGETWLDPDRSAHSIRLGFTAPGVRETDGAAIAEVVAVLRDLAQTA